MNFTLSGVLLALWVFLQSGAGLGWFSVDPKLVGWVGIITVVVFAIEVLLNAQGRPISLPVFHRRPVE